MVVEDAFTITGRGTVVTGHVAAGTVVVGQQVVIDGPGGRITAEIVGLEMLRRTAERAVAGEHVGLLLRGASRDQAQRGSVLSA